MTIIGCWHVFSILSTSISVSFGLLSFFLSILHALLTHDPFYILHALLTLTRIFDCSLFRPYAE